MARTKNQGARRGQLLAAAERAVLRRGLDGVRLRDVAEEAGLTSGAVLYYYQALDDLLLETHNRAIERFCRLREEAVDRQDDPRDQLVVAVRGGLPTGPEDELVRLLYEFEGRALRDRAYGALNAAYYERQAGIYHSVLVVGEAAGVFRLTAPARVVARNLVALEDGYGFYVVLGDSGIDAAAALRLILSYAETATGARLPVP